MILPKIQKWIDAEVFPQRVLLSGGNNALEVALEIASMLQKTPQEKIEKGIHSDTIVFRDTGKSFKIDWSDGAKKDNQGEYENVRGLIRWSHQKPSEGKYRIAILENFERVSRDAPHGLLKLIEEPPLKTIFLFTTRNHHQLLDTILSRMTVVSLCKDGKDCSIPEDIQEFLEGKSLIPKFQKIEELDKSAKESGEKKMDRSVFLEFIETLISVSRSEKKYQSFLELLFETHQAIGQNINPRFVLERLAIKITNS
ncbi:hypothetical protein K9L27_04630 [Candidatus Gracilibacteria bacterium]|nr:hypothetical protein [Candidatus Gracilibacteria bacterium]